MFLGETFKFTKIIILDIANNHFGEVSHALNIIRKFSTLKYPKDYKIYFKLQYRNLETFIHPKILESEITKRCYPNAKTFHNPLFDAVCAYLLIKRLSNKINLNQFLHQEL